jgi:hypothetical protein
MNFDRETRSTSTLDDAEDTSTLRTEGAEEQADHRDGANTVAILAYSYWQQRGCPDGSAEDDWFRAENEVALRNPDE